MVLFFDIDSNWLLLPFCYLFFILNMEKKSHKLDKRIILLLLFSHIKDRAKVNTNFAQRPSSILFRRKVSRKAIYLLQFERRIKESITISNRHQQTKSEHQNENIFSLRKIVTKYRIEKWLITMCDTISDYKIQHYCYNTIPIKFRC